MQELYLIRHGQAGLRTDYDQLSELGLEQARLLGEWFSMQGVEFDAILSGGLKRQRQTAAALGQAVEDTQWNEFDLDAVYACVAPQLAAVDEEFGARYAELVAEAEDPAHPVHRSWRPSDFEVVKAWVAGRFPTTCESWSQFEGRVMQGFAKLGEPAARRMALVTSATPIAVATGSLFGAPVKQVFELAGNLYNTSFTILRWRGGRWTLAGFNHTPHLGEEKLRTMR